MVDQSNTASVFGERVRSHRKDLGLTQTELAQRAETTKQSIGNWETGRWGISPKALDLLAKALGTTPAKLHPDYTSLSPTGGDVTSRLPTGSNTQRIERLEAEVSALRAVLAERGIIEPSRMTPFDTWKPLQRRASGDPPEKTYRLPHI